MIDVKTITILLVAHWIGDFVLQSRWMADNKSKSLEALGLHCMVYGFILLCFTMNPIFVLINTLLHFGIDAFTSRVTKYLWEIKDTHGFFMIIGVDQLLHTVTLILLWNLLQ